MQTILQQKQNDKQLQIEVKKVKNEIKITKKINKRIQKWKFFSTIEKQIQKTFSNFDKHVCEIMLMKKMRKFSSINEINKRRIVDDVVDNVNLLKIEKNVDRSWLKRFILKKKLKIKFIGFIYLLKKKRRYFVIVDLRRRRFVENFKQINETNVNNWYNDVFVCLLTNW